MQSRDNSFSDGAAALWRAYRTGEDPTAFDRLFDALHGDLLRILAARFPHTPSGEVEDAALEAFVFLATKPDRFDPVRAPLFRFLVLIGVRRLTDYHRGAKLRPSLSLDMPENAEMPAEGSVEGEAIIRMIFGRRDPRDELRPDIQAWLEAILPVPRDLALFLLSVEGRLTIEDFSALYEVQTLLPDEQRKEMKRCRDRVQKRVQREGPSLWNMIYGEPLRAADTGKKR